MGRQTIKKQTIDRQADKVTDAKTPAAIQTINVDDN